MNDGSDDTMKTPTSAKSPEAAEAAGAAGAATAATDDASSPSGGRPPDALARVPDDRRIDVDVREDLRAGREPFQRIMTARRSLTPGGVLRVRAIFEPVPLYRVMANQGLDHWTERLGAEDWRVWFFEPGLVESGSDDPAEPSAETERSGEGAADGHGIGGRERSAGDDVIEDGKGDEEGRDPAGAATDHVVLDVRGLEPPEPMVRTLEALEDLPAGATLLQVNARVPRFLLPRLDERGFTWEIDERADDEVRVRIWRA